MLTPDESAYVERMAWAAVQGLVGQDAAVPNGELHDRIREGLAGVVEAAYRRGVEASMVQLSLVPDGAKVIG